MHLLQTIGYPAIFVLALIETVCIPFPSEITFGFPAALAAQGKSGFNLPTVIVVGVLGEICGSLLAYALGRTAGRTAVDRWGKYVLLTHRDLDRTDAFMARRGTPAVAVGRMLPLLRAFVSLVAGIGEMPVVGFGVASAIGTAVYCTGVALAGYALGANWHRIVKGFTLAGVVVAVLVVGAIALAVYHRVRHLREDAGGAGDG